MNNKNGVIEKSAYIKNSNYDPSCNIYKDTRVIDSQLKEKVQINDSSVIQNSIFEGSNTIQRNNSIYNSIIKKYTYTGRNTQIWYADIGSFCSISWNVSIGGANHDYEKLTTHSFLYSKDFGFIEDGPLYNRFTEQCVVGNDVWIGCNAVINRNVTVGHGAVIAAGAVVTKDVEPYTIVGGVPAKPLKKRFNPVIVEELLKCNWWNLEKSIIKENIDLFNSEVGLREIERIKEICIENNVYNFSEKTLSKNKWD